MYSYYKKWDGATLQSAIKEMKEGKSPEPQRILFLDETGKPIAAIVSIKDVEVLEQKPIPELFCICDCNCTWPIMSGPLGFYVCEASCTCSYCRKEGCSRYQSPL